MKIKTLGIFDSGLGGYVVFDALKKTYPDLDMVLYADQKHAPFGNHDSETIVKLTLSALNWFKDQGISDVLLACNTASSVIDVIKENLSGMRVWGIIDLTLSQLDDDVETVGVFGTVATINSHAYQKTYQKRIKEVSIRDLVHAIEGLDDSVAVDDMIAASVLEMGNVDTIILGCTHYPLVKDRFKKYTNAQILDSNQPILDFIGKNYEPKTGDTKVISTLNPEHLQRQVKALFGEDIEVVYHENCNL